MAIALRGTGTTGPNSNSTTTSISLPVGTAINDVSVITYIQTFNAYYTATPWTLTAPSGWTTVVNYGGILICYRVFQSGDATTGIAATSSRSDWWESACVSYSGVDTSNPIDVFDTCSLFNDGQVTTNQKTLLRAPSVNPLHDTGLCLSIYCHGGSSGRTISVPAGFTSRASSASGPCVLIADKALTNGTATGNADSAASTTTNVAHRFGATVVLRASGAAASTLDHDRIVMAGFQNQNYTQTSWAADLALLGVRDGDMVVVLADVSDSPAISITSGPTGFSAQSTNKSGLLYTSPWHTGDATPIALTFSGATFSNFYVVLLRKSGGVSSDPLVLDTASSNVVAGSSPLAGSVLQLTPQNAYQFLMVFVGTTGSTAAGTWSAVTNSGFSEEDINVSGPGARVAWMYPANSPTDNYGATFTETGLTAINGISALFIIGTARGAPGSGGTSQMFLVF